MIDDRFELADLVTNLLAVLVFASVVYAFAPGSTSSQTGKRATRVADQGLPVLQPAWEDLPGLTRNYLVHDGAVDQLDLGVVSQALRTAPDGDVVLEVPLLKGSATPFLVKLGRVARPADGAIGFLVIDSDLNSLELRFSLPRNVERFTTVSPSLTELVAEIVNRAEEEGTIPNFIVSESGFEIFSRLYPALLKEGLCFRWNEALIEVDYEIYRSRRQFGVYQNRRCRKP